MTDDIRVLGSLRVEDGAGLVRMEDRFDVGIDEVWAAITVPERLAGWYGEVDGRLEPGGDFRLRIAMTGERTGRIESCEPPRHLLVAMRDPDAGPGQPEQTVNEAWLTDADGATGLVWEVRGLPVDLLPAYGAGVQLHVEHLGDHLGGRDQRAAESRWDALFGAYQALGVG